MSTRKDHLVQLVAAMTRSSFAVPRAVALLAEIERERCAKIAEAEATKLEEYSETVSDDARFNGVTTGIDSLREVAAAIRGAK